MKNDLLSFYISQLVNIITPFFILFWINHNLSVESYGEYSFLLSISAIGNLIINYGFDLTATRSLVQNDNESEIKEYIYNVMCSKLILSFTYVFICIVLYLNSGKLSYIYISIISFSFVFYNYYYYASASKIYIYSYVQVISKLFLVIIILLLGLKSISDIVLLQAITTFFCGAMLTTYIIWKFGFDIKCIKIKKILSLYKNGFTVFISQASVSLLTSLVTVVININLGDYYTGIYSTVDKFIKAISLLTSPLLNVIFPKVKKGINTNKNKTIIMLNKLLIIGFISFLISYFILWIILDIGYFTRILTLDNIDAINSLKIMYPIALFVFFNNIFGTQYLINIGRDYDFFKSIIISSLLNIVLVLVFSYFKLFYTVISVVVFSQLLLMLLMLYFSVKNGFRFIVK